MGEVPHEPIWKRWFEDIGGQVYRGCRPETQEGSDDCGAHLHSLGPDAPGGPIAAQHLFNVYTHPPKGFEEFGKGSIFRGYEISQRAKTWWLYSSAAMYALVHAAVHNPTNGFFVFLSESCVPLYPAQLVYLQVIHEAKSRLNPGCRGAPDFGRHPSPPSYRRRLAEDEEHMEWHEVTSGQWVLLNRAHALAVDRHPQNRLLWLRDESYLATLLHTLGLENETTCDWQGPTYAEWWPPGDYHPLAYEHFGAVGGANWGGAAPYTRMAETCPLFMRKVMPAATADVICLLWPASNDTDFPDLS
ncbi:hypothetical protein WJX81_006504 [Elliptochloris bilobata]|uniref:Uncharacterized protein n=1 Tax=Elliptochloris bilobata TaxID=381761 RepID=A0AAW1RNP6_9CHLO